MKPLGFRHWIALKLTPTLLGVGCVLVISQIFFVGVLFYEFKKQQWEAMDKFASVGLESISTHQLETLNQLAAMSVNRGDFNLILLCNSGEKVAWSYPINLQECVVPKARNTLTYEKQLFRDTSFPKLVFQLPLWPAITVMVGGGFLVLACIITGFFLLWRIKCIIEGSINKSLLQMKRNNAEFEIEEFAQIYEELFSLKNQEKALAASAAIGNLTTQIIHDIAGPLHSINVARDYLIKLKTDDSHFVDHMRLLELGSTRLNEVAKGLLDKHKGESGDEKQNFLLHDVIHQLENEYRLQCRDVEFQVELPETPIELFGMQTHLQRAFGNIIKNAIEAMKGKGKIIIVAQQVATQIHISITDNGPGMSEATLQKVLGGGYSEGKSDGHGIGMKVVRETIAEFGGELTARSELGKGTSFFITLPLRQSETVGAVGNLKILVIDDDESIRLAWDIAKQEKGIAELHSFASMEDCEAKELNYSEFDLAFIDKNVEGSSWNLLETLTYLKQQGLKKVIISSGEPAYVLEADPAYALADGCSAPFKIPKSLLDYL